MGIQLTSTRARKRGAHGNGRVCVLTLCAIATIGFASPTLAFVYPEHREIARLAVEKLDPAHRAIFDRLWGEARDTNGRLCVAGAGAVEGAANCIDWSALSGIAGDHSCSSADMMSTVLETDWILKVARVGEHLRLELAKIDVVPPVDQVPGTHEVVEDFKRRMQAESVRATRQNVIRDADNQLQKADPKYATRAGSNNAHFLLPRPSSDITAREYAKLTLRSGAEINAMGVYAWFHLSAMQKATRLANETLADDARKELTRAMFFDEAFALHFLEDMFAAGHVAGVWGNASQRKGTHDFYNAAGLEVFPWKGSGQSMVLMGDAHMRPEDADRAGTSVSKSLAELLDTAAGQSGSASLPHTPDASSQPEAFNVCKNNKLGERSESMPPTKEQYFEIYATDLAQVLQPTPVPGLGPGLGAMPRSRSELGKFIGLSGAIDGRSVNGGFTTTDGSGWVAGVDLAVRFGLGLEGVMSSSGDGLFFLSLGLRGDSASTNKISNSALAEQSGNVGAAIPSRMGVSTRLRMPFYLIPGDLLLLSPLYLFSPESYTNMAVTAGNGGLIPWQAGVETKVGRFQFVLGREIGATFYGGIGDDRVVAPIATPGNSPTIVGFRSVAYDFPIAEYRPYRSFSSNQSSSVLFQLFFGIDDPHSASVKAPMGAPTPNLHNVTSIGLRVVFDWRYYP